MANKNSNKHIALTVGANTGLSIGQMRQDLKSIVRAINHKPPEVKITLAKSSITTIQQEIQRAINNGKYTVNFTQNPSGGGNGGNGRNSYLAQEAYRVSKKFGSTGYGFDQDPVTKKYSLKSDGGIPKNISSKYSENSTYLREYKLAIEDVQNALSKLDIIEADFANGNLIDSSGKVVALDQHEKEIEDLIRAYTKLDIVQKALESDNKAEVWANKQSISIKKATDRILNYEKNYGNIIAKSPVLSDKLQALRGKALSGEDVDPKELIDELLQIQIAAKDLGLETDSVSQKFKKLFSHNLTERAISQALKLLSAIMTEVYQKTIELDKATTDLQIATGYSKEETRGLVGEYSSLAKSVGATTTEVSQAADAWLRQGYSVDSTNTLIKNSMMLSKLGQIESAEATTALTSAMKGYNLSVEDTTGIVDKLTSVDMEAAVSAGDLAIAMAETNTGARIAGIGIDRLIGYIATVAEVTQDGAESVGTFYRTLFARMGNIKAGQLIDPETSEDLSDVENVLKGVGIHLRESGGEFRNYGDVLDEVASKWSNYGTVQQRAIAVAFAGTRQQEKFLTLMEHYGEAMGYAEVATDSAGTALEKYETSYLTSVEAAQNKLTASVEEFSQTVLSSATLIDIFDGAANALSGVSNFIDNIGGLSNILMILGNVTLLLNFDNLSKGLAKLNKNFKEGSGFVFKFVDNFKALKDTMTGAGAAGSIASASILGIVAAISLAIVVTKAIIRHNEELYERNRELAASYNENVSAIDNYKSRFEELRNKLKDNSTTEEEAVQIKQELLSIQEELMAQYGEKAEGINLVTGAYEDQIRVLESLTKADYEYFLSRTNQDKLEDVADDYSAYKKSGSSFFTGVGNDNWTLRERTLEGIDNKYGVSLKGSSLEFSKDLSIYEYEDFLEELHTSILKVKDEASEMYGVDSSTVKEFTNWADKVSTALNEVDEEFSENEETFNTYAIGTLQNSDKYSEAYGKMIIAQKQYNDAVKEGNEEKASEAYKKMEAAYGEFGGIYGKIGENERTAADEAANVYVEEFYKAFTEGAEKYKVRVQIDAETDETKNSAKKFAKDFSERLEEDFKSETGKIDFDKLVSEYTAYKGAVEGAGNLEDLFVGLHSAELSGQVDIYEELDTLCTKYGMDVKQLLVMVADMGIIQGEFASAVNNTEDAVNSFSDTMSGLKSAGESIEKLSEAYKELDKDSKVKFSTLAEIQEKFGDVDGIEEYIKALAEADGNTKETAKILDTLLEEAVETALGVESLAEADEDLVAVMLEENGVANAEAKAIELVSKAKAEAKIKTLDLSDASSYSAESVNQLASEFNLSTQQIYALIAAEIAFNNQKLSVGQQIEALTKLAQAAGISAAAISSAQKAAMDAAQGNLIGPPNPDAYFEEYSKQVLDSINSQINSTTKWTPDDSGGSSSNDDPILDAWEEDVKEQKHLLEMDKQTKEQYYHWLKSNYRNRLKDAEKYADEIREIEEELYNWEKEKIQDNIALKESQLENELLNGQISQLEYQKQLAEAYKEAGDAVESNADLYGVDDQERLDVVNDMLNKEKAAHNAAYQEEHRQLEHKLAMNLITEEQYLIELARLYDKYYKGNEMYADEAMEVEEELFSQMTGTIEKWAQAAADAITAIAEAAKGTVEAVIQAIEGSISAHEENFDLEKSMLEHALAMNYISEEEYYKSLEDLYKSYFADKNMYTEQYWENQEEVYQHEQEMLEESADAIEKIHGKVVDLIKKELEETIESIEEAKESYLDLIEVRRKALNEHFDEEDFQKDREEQVASISELQRQLNALANDTSAEGIRKYKEIQEQLKQAEEALEELDKEHTRDQLEKELDNEADTIEKTHDKEAETFKELLDDNIYLTEEAWRRMDGMSQELFYQLEEYNKKYLTSVKDDLTDAWKTATEAASEYEATIKDVYGIIGDNIGLPGMTDEEFGEDKGIVKGKQIWNWVEVALGLVNSLINVFSSLASSFMGIASSVMPGLSGSFMGIAGSLLGGFASGTNYVPKTGLYETDEYGVEELKLLKSPHNGRYTFLTEGSKVINGAAVERLMKLANNPKLLTGGGSNNIEATKLKDLANTIPSVNNQSANITNTFYIKSTSPEGVASEIEKLMPKIVHQTLGTIVSGSNNLGIKRKTQHLY